MPSYRKETIDVLLTTEGTYPVSLGGVSTWCDTLVHRVPGVRYQVYAVLAHPYFPNRYDIPRGVPVLRVPMWGTEHPTDHLEMPFSEVYERKVRTTDEVIRQEFLPQFDELQRGIWDPDTDGRRHGDILYRLYRWFRDYDYQAAMKSPLVWDFFIDGLRRNRWTSPPALPTVADSVQAMGWLYRFLVILNTPVPEADITHASAAAFAGIPGALAKLDRRTPYLLTEHGVYLREQYMSVGRSNLSDFSKQFLMSLVRSATAVNYAYADVIAPVAAFNARWERRYGVPEEKIRVIYNGVDPNVFRPEKRPAGTSPTVVSVARVDPLKDIVTLLRSAAVVHQQMPEVKFVVYGGVSVPAYYRECLALRSELGLDECFVFAGHVDDVASCYASGDVIVLTSVSEGFPYSVIEAMMSGRALVATDVGGTREACAGTGLLVEPRNQTAVAEAIMRLLRDPALRLSLAEEARERALTYFTVQRNLQLYHDTYAGLMAREAPPSELSAALARKRQLALDRARALQAAGRTREAIAEYRTAIDMAPTSPATPVLLLAIAELYLARGELTDSVREMERAEALAEALNHRFAAD